MLWGSPCPRLPEGVSVIIQPVMPVLGYTRNVERLHGKICQTVKRSRALKFYRACLLTLLSVWLPLLLVRMWCVLWNIPVCVDTRAAELTNKPQSWEVREEIPLEGEWGWHLLVLVQLRVSLHLQNMISDVVRSTGVAPFWNSILVKSHVKSEAHVFPIIR